MLCVPLATSGSQLNTHDSVSRKRMASRCIQPPLCFCACDIRHLGQIRSGCWYTFTTVCLRRCIESSSQCVGLQIPRTCHAQPTLHSADRTHSLPSGTIIVLPECWSIFARISLVRLHFSTGQRDAIDCCGHSGPTPWHPELIVQNYTDGFGQIYIDAIAYSPVPYMWWNTAWKLPVLSW